MKLFPLAVAALPLSILLSVPTAYADTKQNNSNSDNVTNKDIESEGLWNKFKRNVSTTWDSDRYELYVPFMTWHNRFTYDKEKTDEYNEQPWGAGIGKFRYDDDNDWHALYAMAFKDSHNNWEPILGYGYQKMWMPNGPDGFKAGAGFTLSITAREEYSYVPVPIPLPLVSVEYNRFAIQATYIPGTHNNGNVFFAWARWQF